MGGAGSLGVGGRSLPRGVGRAAGGGGGRGGSAGLRRSPESVSFRPGPQVSPGKGGGRALPSACVPGATAAPPPPLQSVAAPPRARAPRRRPPGSPSAEPGAEERGAGARAAAREPRRGKGAGGGRSGREGEGGRGERGRAGQSEPELEPERSGREREEDGVSGAGIPLEKSEPAEG